MKNGYVYAYGVSSLILSYFTSSLVFIEFVSSEVKILNRSRENNPKRIRKNKGGLMIFEWHLLSVDRKKCWPVRNNIR